MENKDIKRAEEIIDKSVYNEIKDILAADYYNVPIRYMTKEQIIEEYGEDIEEAAKKLLDNHTNVYYFSHIENISKEEYENKCFKEVLLYDELHIYNCLYKNKQGFFINLKENNEFYNKFFKDFVDNVK